VQNYGITASTQLQDPVRRAVLMSPPAPSEVLILHATGIKRGFL